MKIASFISDPLRLVAILVVLVAFGVGISAWVEAQGAIRKAREELWSTQRFIEIMQGVPTIRSREYKMCMQCGAQTDVERGRYRADCWSCGSRELK